MTICVRQSDLRHPSGLNSNTNKTDDEQSEGEQQQPDIEVDRVMQHCMVRPSTTYG